MSDIKPRGQKALTVGIISVVLSVAGGMAAYGCPCVVLFAGLIACGLGIEAWANAGLELRRIRAGLLPDAERGLATTAYIFGVLGFSIGAMEIIGFALYCGYLFLMR